MFVLGANTPEAEQFPELRPTCRPLIRRAWKRISGELVGARSLEFLIHMHGELQSVSKEIAVMVTPAQLPHLPGKRSGPVPE